MTLRFTPQDIPRVQIDLTKAFEGLDSIDPTVQKWQSWFNEQRTRYSKGEIDDELYIRMLMEIDDFLKSITSRCPSCGKTLDFKSFKFYCSFYGERFD